MRAADGPESLVGYRYTQMSWVLDDHGPERHAANNRDSQPSEAVGVGFRPRRQPGVQAS